MEWSQASKHSTVYSNLHGLRTTDSSQSALLLFVELDSPAALRSKTGCGYYALTAELRKPPGVTHGDPGPGSSPVKSPRGLLVSHIPNLGPGECLDPANIPELHRPVLPGAQPLADQCPELLRHLQPSPNSCPQGKPQHMSP